MKYIHTILLSLFIVLCLNVNITSASESVTTNEAKVSLIVGEYNESGDITVGLHFKLEDGWKIYWRDAGDTGFPPKLDWSKSDNIKSMDMLWPVPTRSRYKLLDDLYTESYEYSDEVVFPLNFMTSDTSKDVTINLKIYFAICKDICIPDNVELSITTTKGFSSAANLSLISNYKQLVPKQDGYGGINVTEKALGEDYFQITVNSRDLPLDKSDIFIESDNDFAFFNPQSFLQNNGKTIIFNVPYKKTSDKADIESSEFVVTIANNTHSIETKFTGKELGLAKLIEAEPVIVNEGYSNLIILVFAFIGGLILNIMPCVLPVLSIKLIGIIKHGGGKKAHVASSFLTTALGIIISFLFLGALVYDLRAFGVNVGWGFHFQEPLFIISLILILSLFAANMWGFYEFRLPYFLSDRMSKKGEGDSFSSHFFTGVFATILATPCTAPFLGTAVGFALTGSFANIFSVFFMMGLGMSLPYLIFSIFPNAITRLPKPGYWMVVVKYIMGVFVALTAIWLIWVLSSQLGIKSALILCIIILYMLFMLHSSSNIKFFNNRNIRYFSYIIILVFAYMFPIKFQAELVKKDNIDIWQELDIKKIDELVNDGNVVFVDVTADWCLTCKVNKILVLEDDEMVQHFKDNNVINMRGDWTNKNDEIANYLTKYDRAGIPFNIVYGPSAPNGIIMSELLDQEDIVNAIKKAKTK